MTDEESYLDKQLADPNFRRLYNYVQREEMMLTAAEAAAIQARVDAATPGPWRKVLPSAQGRYGITAQLHTSAIAWLEQRGKAEDARDADFIAAAPTDISALLAEREAALVQERDAVERAAFYGSDGYLDPDALRRWVAFGGVPMTEATRDHLRQGLRAVVGQVMSDLSAGTWCAFDLRAVLLEMADEADPRKPFKKGAVPPKPAPAAKEDR